MLSTKRRAKANQKTTRIRNSNMRLTMKKAHQLLWAFQRSNRSSQINSILSYCKKVTSMKHKTTLWNQTFILRWALSEANSKKFFKRYLNRVSNLASVMTSRWWAGMTWIHQVTERHPSERATQIVKEGGCQRQCLDLLALGMTSTSKR